VLAAARSRPVKRRPRCTKAGIPLPRIDLRMVAAMRYWSLLDSYCTELGGRLTEPEKALVQQIAAMQLRIETLQAAIVEGRDVDADQIIRLSSEHRRPLTTLRGKAAKNKRTGRPCRNTSPSVQRAPLVRRRPKTHDHHHPRRRSER
jgi:hypothetical protein